MYIPYSSIPMVNYLRNVKDRRSDIYFQPRLFMLLEKNAIEAYDPDVQ
jgi:hypothetical protein